MSIDQIHGWMIFFIVSFQISTALASFLLGGQQEKLKMTDVWPGFLFFIANLLVITFGDILLYMLR